MKKILLSLTLINIFGLLLLSANVAATSIVEFEGGAENFVFYPDGDWTDTDLFGELKDIMPGDKREETIIVRNTAKDYDFINIYLRIESTAEANALLNQLTIGVFDDDGLISDLPSANQDVLLGSFAYGEEKQLTVKVSAPTDLDSDHMHEYADIYWVFTAEAYKDEAIVTPNTGALTFLGSNKSVTETIIFCLLAVVLVTAIYICCSMHKKRS